jgi:Brp/Blh family beta-carotene 15,15'-monooxygenase
MRLWIIQITITAMLGYLAHHSVPAWNDSTEQFVLLFGFLSVGLFHGSADLLLIRNIRNIPKERGAYGWGALYLSVILCAAGLLWWAPQVLLGLFLFGSAFHFGESQMWRIPFVSTRPQAWARFVCYMFWGTWSMASPIVLHPGESREILASLGSFPVADRFFSSLLESPDSVLLFSNSLFCLALTSLFYLRFRKDQGISNRLFFREMVSLFVLQWVFRRTSVLISFGAYFVVWHSLSSLVDQIHCLEGALGKRVLAYVRYAFPNWLISAGLVSVLILTELSPSFQFSKLTLIFGAAILLTPPHLLVIHSLHSLKFRPVVP